MNERLRLYHIPSQHLVEPTFESHPKTKFPQHNSSPKLKSDPKIESDSSSGETLVPNKTPPEKLCEEDEVVLDTPGRPGYVERKAFSEDYINWSKQRRRRRLDPNFVPDESQFEVESYESESWIDVEHNLNFLLKKQE